MSLAGVPEGADARVVRAGPVLERPCPGGVRALPAKGTSKAAAQSVRNNARLPSEDQGEKVFEWSEKDFEVALGKVLFFSNRNDQDVW